VNAIDTDTWWRFHGLVLREPLVLSVYVCATLVALSLWLVHRLSRSGGMLPPWLEAAYALMRDAVADVVPARDVAAVLPFVGALWLFIVSSNLIGLVPGLSAPTRDLSVTGALAVIVFFAVHVYGVRAVGWAAYSRHYLSPSVIMLPFTLIGEVTRTLALAIRLFGNMMSLEMAAMLVLLVAGLLLPVPLLLLHVVEALIQAYIFGMLALIYIGSALEASQVGRLPGGPPETSPPHAKEMS